MSRVLLVCDCGCKRKAYHNQLVEVTVEQAIDPSLRVAKTSKRFWVTRPCKKPFEEELAMSVLLQQLVHAWAPPGRTRWWLVAFWLNPLLPWPKIFVNYCRRIMAAWKVMRLQHAIHERTRGFEYARTRAMQSAIMFGAPRFAQGFLARTFQGRLERIERERAAAQAVIERVELAAEKGESLLV